MEEVLANILMKRFGFSKESAQKAAAGYIAQGKISAATQIADYVPQQVAQISIDAGNAQQRADAERDAIAQRLIPGPRPQAPGNNVPPYLRAAIDARDSVYREAQDPLMAAALKVYGYNDAQRQFAAARETRDMLSKPSGHGEAVDAKTRQYMIDYMNRK